VRIFVVVARSRPDLYQYFVAGFDGVDTVSVILDRRLGAENQPIGRAAQRSSERRIPHDIYDELETRGFVIVRLPAA